MFWQSDGVTATTYLSDVMSVVTEVISIMTSEPIIYFVMLGLIAAAVGTVRKLIPSKRK